MQIESADRIYSSYSGFYDFFFGRFFRPRIREMIRQLGIRPGDRVLELGFGTGISLPYYPPGCEVVGVDVCRSMLQRAAEKLPHLPHLKVRLVEMDAGRLAFPDHSFDHVIGAFMITVVENPYRVISEMLRTCKRNGKLALVNHFQSEHKVLGRLERLFNPLCLKLGWRMDLRVSDLVENSPMEVVRSYRMGVFDPYRIVFFQKSGASRRAASRPAPAIPAGARPSSSPVGAGSR